MGRREREFHDFDPSAIDLWPKIRAIHSEADKEFVRFFKRELAKMCYDVVDDGGRDCRLVLVVLSEEFLISEVCMSEFCDAIAVGSDRLCLFYEFSVEEFQNQNNLAKWMEVWESWLMFDCSIRAEDAWQRTLEGPILDCSTMADGNIIEFMKIIAEEISSKFIPLQVHWSQQTSCIQGRERLCKEVDKCFFEGPLCDEDVRVLGLHGMWSVGKTSLAKALCDFYSTEFQARVYHAELLKKGSHLQLMKDLLKNLLGAKQDFLEQNLTGLGQAYAYLDHCLQHSSEKVFLVVDNIQDSWECLESARDLFLRRVPFPKGSMVLCLARSSHTLEQLLLPLDKHCCIESIPSLNSREGYWIFAHALFSKLSESEALSEREAILWQEVVQISGSVLCVCVDQQPHTMGDVHPLRFKSLGYFFREKGAEYWLAAFARKSADAIFEDIMNLAKWKEHALQTVFQALHKIYDSLDPQVQQVFIEIALYVPKRDLSWLWWLVNDKDDFLSCGFECLQKLRAVTLLTIEDRKIKMHSLCRKFAEKVASDSDALVYVVDKIVSKDDVYTMLYHKADVIKKVLFEDCIFVNGDSLEPFLNLSSCKHIQVLRLLNVKCQESLEICFGHSKLLTLEISSISTPVIVTGDLPCVRCLSLCLDTVAGSKFPVMENLEVLEINMRKRKIAVSSEYALEQVLKRFRGDYEKFILQDFRGACELEVLCLTDSHSYESRILPFNVWPRLRELTLFQVGGLETLGGLNNLDNLRTLHVEMLGDLVSLDGTESLSRLQEVHVIKCGRLSKLQLPGGMWLKHCCIWFCDNLKIITVCDGSVIMEDDDEVDEIRRYYPCPDQDYDRMTCSDSTKSGKITDVRSQKFVSFSSESILSILGCNHLIRVHGLEKLKSIDTLQSDNHGKIMFSKLSPNEAFKSIEALHHGTITFSKLSLNSISEVESPSASVRTLGDILTHSISGSESNQWASGSSSDGQHPTLSISGSESNRWASRHRRYFQHLTHSISGSESNQWASGSRSDAQSSSEFEASSVTHESGH